MALEIHTWTGAVSGDPVVAGNWSPATAPGTAGFETLTITGTPGNNETVRFNGTGAVISDDTYTFKTTINNANPREVLIGATATTALQNLVDAINGGSGSGTTYSSATSASELVTASVTTPGSTMLATAIALGVDGGAAIALTETLAAGSWGFGFFSNGTLLWAAHAIMLFDGTSEVACLGTKRMDHLILTFRQDPAAVHDVGTEALPLRFDQRSNNEHIVRGAGNVYLAEMGIASGGEGAEAPNPKMRVERQAGSPIFSNLSSLPLLVSQGSVTVGPQVSTSMSQSLGEIVADGPDANVTISTGIPTRMYASGGFIDCNVATSFAGQWIAAGGQITNVGIMAAGTRVVTTAGGLFIIKPNVAPLDSVLPLPRFHVLGGVLDASQTPFEIFGLVVKGSSGTVLGGVINPNLNPVP